MNKTQEALKLALEALEECRRDPRLKYEHPYYDKAITAIREALAEPQEKYRYGTPLLDAMTGKAEQPAQQQEPVAEVVEDEFSRQVIGIGRWHRLPNGTKLYTSPQPAQQKPVAYIRKDQLQKAAQSPMLCEVTPEPRQDRIGIYTSPPASKPCKVWDAEGYDALCQQLEGWKAKASKPWVGLTDEDVYPLANAHLRYQSESYEASGIYDLSRAIEAKLKDKNGY